MRAVRKITQAIAALSTLIGLAMAQDQMPWQANLDAAQQLAAKTNRLVLIHCWTPTCQPCARLDKEVFSRTETGRALDPNFVMVKLNCEESPGTARMYGVSSVPTDVIITPNGHLVASIASPPSMNQYVTEMNRAATGFKELSRNGQVPGTAPAAAAAPGSAMMPQLSAGASMGDAAAQNRAAPASAVMSAASPSMNANAAPGNQQTPSSDQYADYFKQQSSAAGPAAHAGPGPGFVQTPAAAQQPAAAPPVAANPYLTTGAGPANTQTQPSSAAPSYAPGSIAGAYPNAASNAAAPTNQQAAPMYGQQPMYQQPPAAAANAATAQPPRAPAQLPPGSAPLGFDGYCPVSLAERNAWVVGEKTWGVVHRGRTYLFAGPEEQKKFWANPDFFSPVMSGNDPVLALDNQVTVPGKREFGVFFNNRVYLFADEATLQRFEQNTNRYAAEALQAKR